MRITSISSTVRMCFVAIAIGCKSRRHPGANREFFNWRRDAFSPLHITWSDCLLRLFSHHYKTLSPASALLISTPSPTGSRPAEVRAASQRWAPLFEKFFRRVNVFAVPFFFMSRRLGSLKAQPQQTSSQLLLRRVHPKLLQAQWVPVTSIVVQFFVLLSFPIPGRVKSHDIDTLNLTLIDLASSYTIFLLLHCPYLL